MHKEIFLKLLQNEVITDSNIESKVAELSEKASKIEELYKQSLKKINEKKEEQ